jgi:apoptosis-inducing factor 3
MAEEKKLSGPDFARGVSLTEFTDGGMLQGHVKGEQILVARRGDSYFAIGAICTHYGASLADGIFGGRYRPLPMAPRLFQSSHR